MNTKYVLQIYIAGATPDMQTMIVDLKEHLRNTLGEDAYHLKVVDVLEKPELAEEERVLATPTMIIQAPEPVKKIILNPNNQESSMSHINGIIKDNESK